MDKGDQFENGQRRRLILEWTEETSLRMDTGLRMARQGDRFENGHIRRLV